MPDAPSASEIAVCFKQTSKRIILNLKNYLKKEKIHIDAVCTKNPNIWDK